MFCVVSQVSLALHMDWVEPAFSFSREDVEPAKRVLDFRVGWFAEPIFGSGDYPLGMRRWLRQLNSLEYKHFIHTSDFLFSLFVSCSVSIAVYRQSEETFSDSLACEIGDIDVFLIVTT